MVSQLNNTKPAREAGYEMAQYIAARVQPLASGADTSVKIGVVPAGAIITHVHSKIVTAFTGGTPVMQVGQLGNNSNLVSAINETTAISEILAPLTNITQPLTADTEFWAGLTGSATAGDAYLAISFIKPVA